MELDPTGKEVPCFYFFTTTFTTKLGKNKKKKKKICSLFQKFDFDVTYFKTKDTLLYLSRKKNYCMDIQCT